MTIKKPEITVACIVFFLFFSCLTALKIVNWTLNQGDSATALQMVDNLQKTGKVYSEAGSSSIDLISGRHIPALGLDEVKKADLTSSTKKPINWLTFHCYLFLYIFAPFSLIDLSVLLPAAIVLSFISILIICYFYLRKKEISILTTMLFVLLIMSHPAFSISIHGQLYPDRFFLGFATLFAFLCSTKNRNKFLFILIAILGFSVTVERTGLLLGIFAILHYILYFKRKDKQSIIKLFVGIGSVIFSVAILKTIINNSNYSSYLITSISSYISYLNIPGVIEKVSIFLFFSSMLWVLSIFDWRASIIALIMLLPNLLGNIGGAEKTGWFSHYHTFYFPFLIWAAAMGLIKLYGMTKKWIVNGLLCLLILLTCAKNPYTPGFSFTNLKDNIVVKSISEIKVYFLDGNAKKMIALKKEFQNSIPPGSKVSAVESAWYPFYKTAHISFYPIGIKEADYVIIAAQKINGGYKYGGFVSYLGPVVAAEVDEYLLEKMKEYGYDLENPVYISPWGHAVIARKKG